MGDVRFSDLDLEKIHKDIYYIYVKLLAFFPFFLFSFFSNSEKIKELGMEHRAMMSIA